jgi:cell division protein FtsB
MLSILLNILKNKYFIVSVLFITWMLFFDPKDWQSIAEKTGKVKKLEQTEKKLNDQIASTKNELNLLRQSAQTIEQYAREKYFMKKDNEDVFIIKSNKE